jgi:hypothetical protein
MDKDEIDLEQFWDNNDRIITKVEKVWILFSVVDINILEEGIRVCFGWRIKKNIFKKDKIR